MSQTHYPGIRPELTPYLRVDGAAVLDVGCGAGGLARALRNNGAKRVVGIEPSSLAAEAGLVCDQVHDGRVEDVLPYLGEYFDFVVAADVLEHLVDPWSVVRELRAHVRPGGRLLVSIPNVSHLSVLRQLVCRKDWRFDDSGLFDRTHLRWFGRASLREMLEQAGFMPTSWACTASICIRRWCWEHHVEPSATRWVPSFLVLQWVVLCRAVDIPAQSLPS